MDAAAELGRNPVSKHQYGAMLKGWKKYKEMILPFTLVLVRRTEGEGNKKK